MTYDKNNRLLTYNGEEVKYDKDGNMTYGPLDGVMTEFVFDCRNRLVQAGDTIYEYDAENNRVAVITKTKRTEYVVNSQPELSQVLQSKTVENNNEESAEVTYYYYGQGLLAQENSKGYLMYHFNNVGSTMAVTDQNGAIKSKYNYSPYGELIEGEYDNNIQFLYNGQYGVTTDGNGLYYMRARYYNVDIKRFINQDVLTGTLERISSLNRYSYVEGNPVSYLDPFGLEPYDTTDLHDYTTCVGLVVSVVTLAFPNNATVLASVAVNGFEVGLYIYDLIGDIRQRDGEGIKNDLLGITFGLIGIVTAGVSNFYLKEAQSAAAFKGMMSGFEYEMSRLYDKWKYYDDAVSKAGLLNQIYNYMLLVVKECKDWIENLGGQNE